MKAALLLVALCLGACSAVAQTDAASTQTSLAPPSDSLRHEGWNAGLWADYANGVGIRSDVHAAGAGARVGRVMTGVLGSGALRGTFELDADLTPIEVYHFPAGTASGTGVPVGAQTYYTGGITPLIMKWNFTKGERWVPFLAAEGGIVFSTKDMPQGDTANVNFTSGAAFGVHHFVRSHGAWTFQGKIYHLSNASLGPHNPGVNAAVQFKIGYTWFKH